MRLPHWTILLSMLSACTAIPPGTQRIRRLNLETPVPESLLAAWAFNEAVHIRTDWRGRPLPGDVDTAVSIYRTRTHLLVAFESRFQRLNLHPGGHEGEIEDLYEYDVVEFFVDPDPATPQTYLEFELDPGGRTLDLRIDRAADVFDATFDSSMTSAVSVDPSTHTWRALMMIPFGPELEWPSEGAVWRGNFFRIEGAGEDRLYMALSPTGTASPSFHVPEAFIDLTF